MRGRAFVWFGSSALSVAVIYYCMAMLARFVQYLSVYSLQIERDSGQYLGPGFPPISLLGLLFKEGAVATAVPHSQVSVVIPVYNGEETIESCVRHVQGQSLRPFEVIVVDDCSADMTPVKLGELSRRHPNMVVLRNSKNLGKAASVNAVLGHVGSSVTGIVDSDTYLDGDYLRNTLSVLNGDGTVGASGMVLPSYVDGNVSRSRFIEYLHGQSTYKGVQNKLGATFVSPGCCSVQRTDWIKRNGIHEETVVEDMDLTWEAQIDGGRIAFNPEALAFTEEPGSLGAYVRQLQRWFSWRPIFEKHRGELSNGLKALVSWMLAESVGYLFWLGVMLYLLFSGRFVLAFVMFLGDLVLVSLISLYHCRRIGFPLSKVLVSIPYYYALRIPTALVFWESFLFPKRKGWLGLRDFWLVGKWLLLTRFSCGVPPIGVSDRPVRGRGTVRPRAASSASSI